MSSRRISDRIKALEAKTRGPGPDIFSPEQSAAFRRIRAAVRHALGIPPEGDDLDLHAREFEHAVVDVVSRLDAGTATNKDLEVLRVGDPSDIELCDVNAERMIRVYANLYQACGPSFIHIVPAEMHGVPGETPEEKTARINRNLAEF